jgi:hypothetical protein
MSSCGVIAGCCGIHDRSSLHDVLGYVRTWCFTIDFVRSFLDGQCEINVVISAIVLFRSSSASSRSILIVYKDLDIAAFLFSFGLVWADVFSWFVSYCVCSRASNIHTYVAQFHASSAFTPTYSTQTVLLSTVWPMDSH